MDWALASFSGYLAADELYDGPFCVLSAVDARHQRRLLCEVLDHDPTQVDVLFFLARLHDRIRAHGHAVLGITTDGSPLYPQPIALALGRVDIHRRNCNTHNNLWSLDHFGHICSKPLYCKLLRGDCPHDLTTIH